jgi:hypothetical protein
MLSEKTQGCPDRMMLSAAGLTLNFNRGGLEEGSDEGFMIGPETGPGR